MGGCHANNPQRLSSDESHEEAVEQRYGNNIWLRFPGPVYLLKQGLTKTDLFNLNAELNRFRKHHIRHVRGPFHVYDDLDYFKSAKMIITYNYYTAPRPGEPMPETCLGIANTFLSDFGSRGCGCLAIQYLQAAEEAWLPWHVDQYGFGGPVLTMSWGSAAKFEWRLKPDSPSRTVDVKECDVLFFDGGQLEHKVSVQGERYNVQVRVYDATSELSALPLDSLRRNDEKIRTRYPFGSPYTQFCRSEQSIEEHSSSVRLMYIDLLIKLIRNEKVREISALPDTSQHDLARAEQYFEELKTNTKEPIGVDILALLSAYIHLVKTMDGNLIYPAAMGRLDQLDDDTWERAGAHLAELRNKFGDQLQLSTWDVYAYFIANSPAAHSLGDRAQLENTHTCVELVLASGVPGDFIETGVWQGGQCILMRGILKAHGVRDRVVYVADSFQGLPDIGTDDALDDAMFLHVVDAVGKFQVTADVVRENFSRYGLLDEQVVFLEGWFHETLPKADFGCFAIIRLDGDFYESTKVAIEELYPRLSSGGFVIVDDYGCPFGCKRAIDEYRFQHNIDAPVFQVNSQTAFWRKP